VKIIPSFHWFRTVFYLIPTVTVFTVVLGAVSVASALFDRQGSFAHRTARVWSWLILATTHVRVRVIGLERLEPDATYIFVANHQSYYDIPVIFSTLPFQLRIIAKSSLGLVPFLGWHLRGTGHLLVDRRKPDRGGILKEWLRLVSRRLSLIVFPEGTRSVDGRLGHFKGGSFLLAIQAGVPVVPVTITGTGEVMRKGRLTVRPGDVSLVVHDPIVTASGWRATVQDARALASRVSEVVAASLPDQRAAAAGRRET
jgi:1-acyl-sn-glycerol-3-phosphate acyltransferase